jgi:hypothetical protein
MPPEVISDQTISNTVTPAITEFSSILTSRSFMVLRSCKVTKKFRVRSRQDHKVIQSYEVIQDHEVIQGFKKLYIVTCPVRIHGHEVVWGQDHEVIHGHEIILCWEGHRFSRCHS